MNISSRQLHKISIFTWACFYVLPFVVGAHERQTDQFPAIVNSPSEDHLKPMDAQEAAARMKVPDGFRVTVFASEPDVQNPIALAWDKKDRMWVAENFTYSDRKQRFDISMRDRVLIFTDSDGDGKHDERKVFTDKVQMLTSVEVGHGGVWLMCPPRLIFIPDANGDDIPDGPPQVMLDGFDVAKNNYHNFANGLRWGPDGWLYGRCGHSCPGWLGVPGTPKQNRVPIDGGIWRFHPTRKIVEVLCHGTVNPWGHDWDAFGELFFVNTVIGHVWHMIPGAHFKESSGESMNADVFERMDMIGDHYHFDTKGRWSDSRDGKANDFGGGHSHCGTMIYQNGHWPRNYHNKLFTLNMHGRRANVERIGRRGSGFVASHEPDVLLCEDPFFRGLDIREGPDGNVFVLDWSDTGECHEHTGVHRTSGRIFKVIYVDDDAVETNTKSETAKRLQALWKQYRDGDVSREDLHQLLQEPDERLRVWAIRLLTDFWPLDTILGPRKNVTYPDDSESIVLLTRVAREEQSSLVMLTLASTLQRVPVEHRFDLASQILSHKEYADDPYLPYLVWYGLIPLAESSPSQLATLAANCEWPRIVQWATRSLARRAGTTTKELDILLQTTSQQSRAWQESLLKGLQDAYRGRRQVIKPKSWELFKNGKLAQDHQDAIRDLEVLFGDGRALAEIRTIVVDRKASLNDRRAALESYIRAKPDDLKSVCESLLEIRSLNLVAAEGLAQLDDAEIGRELTKRYSRFNTEDRTRLLEILTTRKTFADALLDSVGEKKIPHSVITAFHARQIQSLADTKLNGKLAKVWGEVRETPAERRQLIADVRKKLTRKMQNEPNLGAGRVLFEKNCGTCHKLYGEGKVIGPDLTGSQRANLDYLLENILDPGATVGKDYRMSIVVLDDGRVLNGLVVSSDETTVVLQTQTKQMTILKTEIVESKLTSQSPMPDGLLKKLSEDQVRDLIAYLRYPYQVPRK